MARLLVFYLKHALLWFAIFSIAYWVWLDRNVTDRFERRQWDLPARVYASPQELFVGARLSSPELELILTELGYEKVLEPRKPGQFNSRGRSVLLVSRDFIAPDGREPSHNLVVYFDEGHISALVNGKTGGDVALARLDPLEIGTIHPGVFEDRRLLKINNVPPEFIDRLIAVEDRRFMAHPGIDLFGIARALGRNLLSGKLREGGSTITQQLVKNLYLSRERTFRRKLNEALMALSIERKYSKAEILETYVNEIFLGQDGNRAIHGFGLGAYFYFGKPLNELNAAEQAMLIGLAKGPSAYNPRRSAERALGRRNLVLKVIREANLLTEEIYQQAVKTPLRLVVGPAQEQKNFKAFIDLVHSRLLSDYDKDALQTQGLRIFTTFDLRVQQSISRAAKQALVEVDRRLTNKTDKKIQFAAVITEPGTAEVKALLAGRESSGNFNRALNARRQIGSLIKPFIYAEALSLPKRYHLATRIEDKPVILTDERGEIWKPENYDRSLHGSVRLIDALSRSYNLATIALGLQLGLPAIVDRLHAMGFKGRIAAYPSMLLGAVDMTPLEVAQIYQSLANEGYYMPLRAIRAVLNADGKRLSETPTEVRRALPQDAAFLTNFALQEVVKRGTARALTRLLPRLQPLAGKTGTSDSTRDAWFAGFGSNYLGVVWTGYDDNSATGLTGASGALPIWASMMQSIGVKPLSLTPPNSIFKAWVSEDGLTLYGTPCDAATEIPISRDNELVMSECTQSETHKSGFWDRLKGIF